jgi:hypothetical protein
MPDHRSSIRRHPVRVLAILAIALLAPGGIRAQSVAIQQGNVVYQASPQSAPRQLTAGGLDSEPALSPDGRMVAFIRRMPGDSVRSMSGPEEANALWIMRVDGGDARMLVRARFDDDPQRMLLGLQHPRFSPDGGRIYFLSSAWVTSGSVHAVEVASGTERFVAPANTLEVVPSGEYAGHLIVAQHRYFIAGGSYDWLWLVTPDGEAVGPVGENDAAVEQFRELYVTP